MKTANKNIADINPVTNPFCQDCKFWKPVGFYTWEREKNPDKRKCKYLKQCERVYKLAKKETKIIKEFVTAESDSIKK